VGRHNNHVSAGAEHLDFWPVDSRGKANRAAGGSAVDAKARYQTCSRRRGGRLAVHARSLSGADHGEALSVNVDVAHEGPKAKSLPEASESLGKERQKLPGPAEHGGCDAPAAHVPVDDLGQDVAVRLNRDRLDT